MKKLITIFLMCVMLAAVLSGCGKKDKEVTLGQYKGLSYKKADITVSDSDLDALLQSLQNKFVTYEVMEDRLGTAVKKGDIVNIDYSGTLVGETVPFEGGTAKGTHLEIGSNTFIPGFEDGLVGIKVGETTTLKLTFPETYYASMAGKAVEFVVTVNSVEKKNVPPITDQLISDYTNKTYTTVESYKEYAKRFMMMQQEVQQEESIKNELVKQVISSSKFGKLDTKQIDSYYNDMITYYSAVAQRNDMSLEHYVLMAENKSMDEFRAELRGLAEDTLKESIVLNEIIAQEKITLSEEQYKTNLPEYLEEYGYSTQADLEAAYGVQKIRQSMLYDMAMQYIYDNATAVTE